ncbi:MAG: S8 family peptidase [Rhodothermales bacterium]
MPVRHSRSRRPSFRHRAIPYSAGRLGLGALLLACAAAAAVLAPVGAHGQTQSLSLMADGHRLRAETADQRVSAWLAAQPFSVPRFHETPDGTLQLVDVVGGRPRWYQTHNHRAMATIRVDRLHTASPTGWNLDGAGETIGLWDASGVRRTHVELVGRVVQRDAPWHYLNHATHVAGTMVAAGVRPEARGAAPAATLNAWDWNNDTAEMAAWAAEGGLVSNHSYGQTAGWVFNALGDGRWVWQGDPSVDAWEDYRFGFYDDLAAAWDALAAAAPYYMILKSAGNEALQAGPSRGEPYHVLEDGAWRLVDTPRLPDGGTDGYDTLVDASVAKNVLTVGAVRDIAHADRSLADIQLLDGSSRGPTDDGRIKPDVVASGELVLSGMTWGDAAYGTSSGTSHASPAVAGLAGLLQSLHRTTFGVPMTAASMKGLLIHTTDEAGPAPGPDYGFGWGLVNAERAAHVVSRGRLHEAVLQEGTEDAWELLLQDGEPLHVTLAWTDPVPVPGQDPWAKDHPVMNDRTPRLVNDLDLRVTTPSGDVLSPWVLDPDRPAAAAGFGDNRVDVVEQVSRVGLPAGTYRVSVRHKGGLDSGAQAYSLLLGLGSGNDAPAGATTLAGRVHTGGAGLDDVVIRLVSTAPSSPAMEERQTRTGRDGTFLLDGIPYTAPGGTWTLHVEDAGTLLATTDVVLPRGSPVDVAVPAAFRLDSYALLRSPNLLSVGESAAGQWESTAVAGGLYGVSLTFEEQVPRGLAAARVVLDTDSAVPWMGDQADAWLSASVDWLLTPSWGTFWSKRVPMIWFSGDAPPGTEAVIPWRILHPERNLVLAADTLRIPITGPDNQAPIVRTHARKTGLGYALPGGRLDIETLIWDGSPVASATGILLDARNPASEIGRMTLADNGVLGTHGDLSYRDGVWTGRFRPPGEADYRLRVEAVDAIGNRTVVLTNGVYSSRAFSRSSDVAVWTSAWFAVPTADLWSDLGHAGIAFDGWDTFMRGGPPNGRFDEHDVLLWMPSADDLARADIRAEVERTMAAGAHVVLILSSAPPTEGQDWIRDTFGVDVVPRSGSGANEVPPFSRLVSSFEGWPGRPATLPALALGLRPGSPVAPEPLVDTGPDVFVVQSGAHVVATLVPAPDVLPVPAHRSGYVSRLLHAASGLPTVVPEPRAPAGVSLSLEDGNVVVSWSPHPFATYEAEVLDDHGLLVSSVSTPDTVWTVTIGPNDPVPVSARVRARTLAGSGPWAGSAVTTDTGWDGLPERTASVGSAWPSPTTGRFRIPVTLAAPGAVGVTVYRVDGRRTAIQPPVVHPAGTSLLDVDLTGHPAGVYLLHITMPTGPVHRSIVITR